MEKRILQEIKKHKFIINIPYKLIEKRKLKKGDMFTISDLIIKGNYYLVMKKKKKEVSTVTIKEAIENLENLI